MADFCAECALETFGEDTGDMAGQSTPEDTEKGMCMAEFCEGCGVSILVDHTGLRMTQLVLEPRIVNGEERHYYVPRPQAEIDAARARLAAAAAA